MKSRFLPVTVLIAVCAAVSGCGSKEREARERERMDLEEQSRRDAEMANKAITDLNRKMFARKPTEPSSEASAAQPPKPDEKAPAPAGK
jgi:hypothetical protein